MARPREYTMDEIEAEIARLQKSEAVRLARKEQKIYNKRKAYMRKRCACMNGCLRQNEIVTAQGGFLRCSTRRTMRRSL